jgi:methylmalonyl-CoA/ethylmalonyl-CoA epimerase
MAKLRHLALIVEDPETSADFFAKAFGMERCDGEGAVCRVTDGTVSVALLPKEFDHEAIGIHHFGLQVDDIEADAEQAISAGAVPLGAQRTHAGACYEEKYRTPDGIVFDLSHTGWPGAGD